MKWEKIPEGYKVEYLPKNVNHDGKIMTFDYNTVEKENRIEVVADYQLKNVIYPAKDYQTLKSAFNYLINTLNEMIVLSKIKNI